MGTSVSVSLFPVLREPMNSIVTAFSNSAPGGDTIIPNPEEKLKYFSKLNDPIVTKDEI